MKSIYNQIVDDILPNALMIGVDYDLFWTLNPKTMRPFHKAFSLRQQYEDNMAWHQGKYIQMAVASLFSKKAKYPTEPFHKMQKTPEERMQIIKERFTAQANVLNSRFKE